MSFFGSVFRRAPPPTEPEKPSLPSASSAQSVLMNPPSPATEVISPAPAASAPSVVAPVPEILPSLTYKDLSADRIKDRLINLVQIPSTITNEEPAIRFFLDHFNYLQTRYPAVADRLTIDFWVQDTDQLFQSEATPSSSSSSSSSSSDLSTSPSASSAASTPPPTSTSEAAADELQEPAPEADRSASSSSLTSDNNSSNEGPRKPPVQPQETANKSLPCVSIKLVGKTPAGPNVLLAGHVDVAPAGNESTWKHGPFSDRSEDGFVFGRGSSDMKSGLAAVLEIFQLFVASGGDFSGSLTFLVTSGDLDGGLGTLSAIQRGYRPDFVILPKPTSSGLTVDPSVVVAHAGSLTYSIRIEGRAANSCKRMEGESAFAHFLSIYGKLNQAERHINERETNALMRELVLPYPTCLGKIAGGDWASSVMDRVEASVRFGVMLGESITDAQQRITHTISDACHDIPWLSRQPPSCRLLGNVFESSSIPVDHPLVDALSKAGLRVFGRKVRVAAAPYGSAMALWNNVARVPCVLYGPGDIRLSQAPNEHVEVRAVHLVAQVLLEAVAGLLKSPLQRGNDLPSYEEQLIQQNDSLQKEILLLQGRKRIEQQRQQQQAQREAEQADAAAVAAAETSSTTGSQADADNNTNSPDPAEAEQPASAEATSETAPSTSETETEAEAEAEAQPKQQSWSFWADLLKI